MTNVKEKIQKRNNWIFSIVSRTVLPCVFVCILMYVCMLDNESTQHHMVYF